MNKEDGPNSKWTKTVDIRQLGNMPSSPEMQNKVAELTQTFPTPRVQIDDGDQDIADLHAREDLLLDNYTLDRSVEGDGENSHRARHGADCAARVCRWRRRCRQQPLMAGDNAPAVTMPLTNGFAPHGL